MKIHFIGIGGIGISALAQYYLEKGHKVTGSDLVSSEITDYLKKSGVKFSEKIPEGTNTIIYTSAFLSANSLFNDALEKGIRVKSYPEALGEITKEYFTIAVSGTHGKSTTSSMIGLLLQKAGLDPTVIIGTKLKEFGNTNFRIGKSKYLVIEADEWNFSFLSYWPQIIVLTNIEEEHMDSYKNLNHILKTYKEYISHLGHDGVLVINKEDKNIKKLVSSKSLVGLDFKIKEYSIEQKEKEELEKIMKVPGQHNLYNALAVLTTARELGIPDSVFFEAMGDYKGAWRRFEEKKIKIGNKNITLIADYAHHPTEIEATLKTAREKFKNKKISCVFQPHQYQRTHYLLKDFISVFAQAEIDEIIITDIYDVAGRENKEIKKKINSKKLVKKICQSAKRETVIYICKDKLASYLREDLENGQILIIMGAGDIYQLEKGL